MWYQKKNREQLLNIGVDRYLTKPIDDIELWGAICELLHVDSTFRNNATGREKTSP